jgi:hypothetical protein
LNDTAPFTESHRLFNPAQPEETLAPETRRHLTSLSE